MAEEPEIVVTDARTGDPYDGSVLEEHDVAFDAVRMHLDLTKAENRRTTALMMAIQGYKELIIKDAEYLKEVRDMSRRDEGPKIQPATIDAIVEAAIKFDMFIAGQFSQPTGVTRGGAQTEEVVETAASEPTEDPAA